MDTLKSAKKLAVLSALIEGCSIRAASRMTGVHKTTIMKLLSAAGKRCQELHNEQVYAVRCEAVECDEIWTFIQKKQRRLTEQDPLIHPDYGDIYTFVAFEPVSKVVIAYAVGKRDASTANNYILDLRQRVTGRPQISTDAFAPYIDAVEQAFGSGVDYAQIVKLYAGEHPGPGRYSPPHVVGVEIHEIMGTPVRSKICTSYVERNNLTIRLQVRRFTRLTNAFSRKPDNLRAAVSLWFWYYNFCRVYGSLRVTPAMAAGVTNRIWELEELAA